MTIAKRDMIQAISPFNIHVWRISSETKNIVYENMHVYQVPGRLLVV